jgi:hypothetical protein
MPRKSMKSALSASLQAEDEAVKSRFEAADRVLATSQRAAATPSVKQSQSTSNRVVRDSFTLPTDDYELIAAIRQRCLGAAVNVTKSEVIRAGLQALMAMPDAKLLKQVSNVEKVKSGRPKKDD